ncbi:hypothetical protein [Castellaniella defragrans]|uniref:hypothetical protein n=1 Tax=Castellaniella defragrans TaxID=75697 RepID=UPI002AFE3E37|nr:hypothetical protein [Castellaniella defragrans]
MAPFWALGGGTVLMFRHHHRLSQDFVAASNLLDDAWDIRDIGGCAVKGHVALAFGRKAPDRDTAVALVAAQMAQVLPGASLVRTDAGGRPTPRPGRSALGAVKSKTRRGSSRDPSPSKQLNHVTSGGDAACIISCGLYRDRTPRLRASA